jgi:hypothetical protein
VSTVTWTRVWEGKSLRGSRGRGIRVLHVLRVLGLAWILGLGCEPEEVRTKEIWLPLVRFAAAQAAATAEVVSEAPAAWFVATTGRDADPGTEDRPFRTIRRGVRNLRPGGTLYIRGGTYEESLENVIPGGTSWQQPVRVVGYPGDDPVVLRPEWGTDRVLYFEGATIAFISVENLVLDASRVTYDAVKITYGQPDDAAHHIRLLRCEVKNSPMQGILVTPGSNDNQFVELNVHDNGTTDFGHGVYIASQNNVVEESTIHQNAGWGIHIYSAATTFTAHGNLIRRNRVWGNARAGARGVGIVVRGGWRNQVIDNLVFGNNGGIEIGPGAPGTLVRDNVVFANGAFEIQVRWGSFGSRVLTSTPARTESGKP